MSDQQPQQQVPVNPEVAAYLINQLTESNARFQMLVAELQARVAELEAATEPDQEPDLAGAAVQG
jgi:hypothetical protein